MKFLIFLLLISSFAFGSEDLTKIAICSDGETKDSPVSSLAGRANYFQIYDLEGNLLEIIENPYKDQKSGVGPKVIEFLSKKGIKKIVAGKFGEKIIDILKEKDIKYLEFKGKVQDALKNVIISK